MKRIVVKIGSAVLSGLDGGIKREVIARLVEDVSLLMKGDYQVVMVTSGAVNTGRSALPLANPAFEVVAPTGYDRRLLREQILAAVGQPKLMAIYGAEFDKHDLSCAQLLTTRSDFADRKFYLSLRIVTEGLLRRGIVPIFNENDVLTTEELDFSDNDEQALMIAAMMLADRLVILTDVAGVYDRPPKEAGAQLIPEIIDVATFVASLEVGKFTGKGGILSKLHSAEVITSLGIPMHIASGFERSPLSRILKGEQLGTAFPTAVERVEAKKGWLTTAAAGAGKIVVSTYLAEILRRGGTDLGRKTPSVLLPGIETVEGGFEKGDVIEVLDDAGILLGRGMSRESSGKLREKISWYMALPDEEKEKVRMAEIIAVHANDFVFAK